MARRAATSSDSKGVHDGEAKLAEADPAPTTRTYAEAIAPEVREALGADAPVGNESAQAAVSS